MTANFSDVLLDQKDNSSIDAKLTNLLGLVRKHLNMDVAFISEFINDERVFKVVDNPSVNKTVKVGNSDPINETYCHKITEKQLSPIITNSKINPITQIMPVTDKLNIGAYIGVPINLSNGKLYGTFCCYKSHHDESLNERDLSFLNMISEIATGLIEKNLHNTALHCQTKLAIDEVIASNSISIYFQPIFNLFSNEIAGFESLSRFFTKPYKTPDLWFKEATDVGLGESLEMLAIKNSLAYIAQFNDTTYIAINCSPSHILSGALEYTLQGADCSRLVLEITEHSPISDYTVMRAALAPLRKKGLRLAIDDVGAGFSSFQHILELEADIIKLDISLTQNINKDNRKFLLAKALCGFAKAIDCSIVAEGIETQAELNALRKLNVDNVQGYFIGRPAPIEDALSYQSMTLST
ncbi:MAG: EAL domain-containing protein (putative c-di-GMP-specific phosphodiesterase class I) [Pseudoalteromonas rhizosphaerae]|jgi:EAL domain-containing protein (putative c-di-GMP-specific phosphodiesterase class I)|uniref:EAL domain-containing protein n=1 Tax=Pseudoalteromonas neustonica TaxID=1840331 RepID=A0ABY3FIQ1_9GAMM|nr:EAL domain-containing protein [Pseudoalteromonas neustonica]TVU86487.1 EAL domain-containing protein [Pseudoalteromonas neustonica]